MRSGQPSFASAEFDCGPLKERVKVAFPISPVPAEKPEYDLLALSTVRQTGGEQAHGLLVPPIT